MIEKFSPVLPVTPKIIFLLSTIGLPMYELKLFEYFKMSNETYIFLKLLLLSTCTVKAKCCLGNTLISNTELTINYDFHQGCNVSLNFVTSNKGEFFCICT